MILDTVLKTDLKIASKSTDSQEKIKRSLVKTISWRIIGTLDTILISWLITGTLSVAFSIGVIELVTKMILYFFTKEYGIK